MKKCFKMSVAFLLLAVFTSGVACSQTKKGTKSSVKSTPVKFTEKEFGSPTSIAGISDITENSPAYNSVKSLVENYRVTTTYSDSTFKGKDPLRRGDFVVELNSALVSVRKAIDAAGLDTSLINTYDKNASYVTSISELKDLQPSSIYYAPTQSLIEKFGIAAPFTKSKMLNAGGTVTEKEVYDILNVTLGYHSSGANPYSTAMTREKFAIVLNNAVSQKMSEVNALQSEQQAKRDEDRRRQIDSLNQMENVRRDSIAKEIKERKMDAAKQEEEAKKKLAEKKRN